MTPQPTIVDTIRHLVDRQLSFSVHGYELSPDDDLWKMGLSSLTCLGLMLSIEDTFGIELPQELLKESTFRSVNTIVAAVEDARRAKSPSAEAVSPLT